MRHILLAMGVAGVLLACASPAGPSTGTTGTPASAAGTSYAAVVGTAPAAESILAFNLASPAVRGIVNRFDHSIRLYLPAGSGLTSLTPVILLAAGVTVSSPPAGPVDLSAPVVYTLSNGASYTVQAFAATPTAATVNAWLGTGINLGNDLDAWPGEEGSWTGGVVARKYFFDDYRNLGFNSVRIPITWGGRTDRLTDAGAASQVSGAFMDRVETLAGWGIDAGLAVVINAHHEDWIRTLDHAGYLGKKARFVALWTQIAERFKSWPPQLVFEILNEPQGAMTNADVNDLNAAVLAVIRASNPTRVVIIGGNSWNSIASLQDGVFAVPADPLLIATFHNYNPWSFAGQSAGTWGSAADIAAMDRDLSGVAAWAAAHGNIPLYMGEYGVTFQSGSQKTDLGSRAAWYRQVSRLAKAKGISRVAWDDSGDFKLYDRVARTYDSAAIPAVLFP
jgi:endoglucanase